MKKGFKLIPSLLLVSLTCACTPPWKHFSSKEYCVELPFHDQFLICQLSDLHFSTVTDLKREFAYLDVAVRSLEIQRKQSGNISARAMPDLIVINGDSFMNANRYIVEQTFQYFESLNIPYAFTYGNHDQQGSYTSNFIRSILEDKKNYKHSLFKDQRYDDVYGVSNYAINLIEKNKLLYQIFIMDSNSYLFGDYDNIHDDQVDWYERVLLESNGYSYENKPAPGTANFAPSLAFFHIPTTEFKDAIDSFKPTEKDGKTNGDNFCNAKHAVSSSSMESKLLPKMQELKSTVGIGVAHDHTNSTDLWYKGDSDWPIRLIYGNKTGDNAGHDKAMIGATFYELNKKVKTSKNGNDLYFNLTKMLVNYDGEVKVEWSN